MPIRAMTFSGGGWLGVTLILLTNCGSRLVQARQELQYIITEDIKPGEIVGNVADDAGLTQRYDNAALDQLQFRFLAQPRIRLVIDEATGVLRVADRIDRDAVCPNAAKCRLRVDVAVRPVDYFQIIKIIIDVRDFNDNNPIFLQQNVAFEVLESAMPGTSFILPTAVDPDSPQFGIQKYIMLTRSTHFKLEYKPKLDGTLDVRLVLKSPLDRETREEYKVKVAAVDGGNPPKSGSVNVHIRVLDANDNQPVFDNTTYNVLISENTPVNTRIAQVHARDDDAGVNAKVTYSFTERTRQSHGHLFGIKNKTGEIFVKGNLDYEQSSTYHLSVIAMDSGSDPVPSDATVIITLLDQNDHAPKITLNTLHSRGTTFAEIMENAEVGTFVAHITVKDPDAHSNGRFDCNINDNNFKLQKLFTTEYKLISAVRLDRESRAIYRISITCQDEGTEPRIATKHIRILVGDANDHTPVFRQKIYTAIVSENNYIGAFIIQVNATDLDSGSNGEVVYSIDSEVTSYLKIDKTTGTITARKVFNHEELSKLQFRVSARDKGSHPRMGHADVTVNIVDVNDNAPVFEQRAYSFSVFENEPARREVGVLHASDADSSPYNQFEFSLEPERAAVGRFSVDPHSGLITTRVVLDREEHALYYLLCVIKDKGVPPQSSSASVTIYVADKNDNSPKLQFPTQSNNTVHMSTLVPVGHYVTRIHAYDKDTGANAKLIYSFADGNQLNIFQIRPESGIITVEQSLKHVRHAVFELAVIVRDNGLPRRATRGYLNVVVNASLPYLPPGSFTSQKETLVVVSFATVAGVITLALLALIVYCLQKGSARQRNAEAKYNCRAKPLKPEADADDVPMTSLSHKTALLNGGVHTADPRPVKLCETQGLSYTVDIRGEVASLTRHSSRDLLEDARPSSPNLRLLQDESQARCYQSTEMSMTSHACQRAGSPGSSPGCAAPGQSHVCPSPRPAGCTAPPPALRTMWPLGARDHESQQLLHGRWKDADADSEHSGETGSNPDSGRGASDSGAEHRAESRERPSLSRAGICPATSPGGSLRGGVRRAGAPHSGDESAGNETKPGPGDAAGVSSTARRQQHPPASRLKQRHSHGS